MNLNLRVFAAVLILAGVIDAPVFATDQGADGQRVKNPYHIDRTDSLTGLMLLNASEECRELLLSQCLYSTRGDNCPKLIEDCEEKVSAREREAQEPAAIPKTPEPTAEPNAADAKEDTDTSSGAEEEESSDESAAEDGQSSDEVADPELDSDAAVEEEADSEEQSDDGEAENERNRVRIGHVDRRVGGIEVEIAHAGRGA